MIEKRRAAVREAIADIKQMVDTDVSVDSLTLAKGRLMELASQSELFPYSDFPIPSPELIERTDLIHEEPDGSCALYVNSSLPGQQSRPHNHGGAWAIVAAVSGEEEHRVYVETDPADGDEPWIAQAGTIIVKPGTAISILPDGIHSIHAVADAPLLHLHLYAKGFALQGTRREYDLENHTIRKFVLEDLGFIQDKR